MTAPSLVGPADPIWAETHDFLYREAAFLDDNQFSHWLGLLDPAIRYRMPVRTSRLRADGPGFDDRMFHFDENFDSLSLRVRRLDDTQVAWAEDPPSRTRRFVSNVRVQVTDTAVQCKSYLLVVRSRWDDPSHELISAERHDALVRSELGLRLVSREIRCDDTTLGTNNLAIFL